MTSMVGKVSPQPAKEPGTRVCSHSEAIERCFAQAGSELRRRRLGENRRSDLDQPTPRRRSRDGADAADTTG